MKYFFILLLLISKSQSQTLNELHSPENIRKFAEHLFSEKDYLRSVFEFERLPSSDTVNFKIALAYQLLGNYNLAIEKFQNVKPGSVFYNESEKEYYKTLFLNEDYNNLQKKLVNRDEKDFQRWLYLSYLFTSGELPERQDFLKLFPSNEKETLLSIYNHKKEPPYKSSILAGIMSTIIPGSGKIYLGEIEDGITAFLAASLLAFLSYDNFSHNHNFRGWLFAGLGGFFYAGNIYGSLAAAQIYNAKVDYEFNTNLKEYLQNKNYFSE